MPALNFDYIIAGAGASGLNLAYALNQAGLTAKRILLIERAHKALNDRTWCFWEAGDNPFESIVYRKWDRLAFHGDHFDRVFTIAPYQYKLLRGIDFYQYMDRWLAQQPNIERVQADVLDIKTAADGNSAIVTTPDQIYRATWVFSSIRPPALSSERSELGNQHFLLQHFKGWVIETEHDTFDPDIATLMDFRVPQPLPRDMRFVYVMPFGPRRALVEYTVFSPAVLPDEEYRTGLRDYLRDVLHLDEYVIQEEESGVIPMTDAPFDAFSSPRVMNIGTAGGRTKPSTGYTFLRIQAHSRQIAQLLKTRGDPYVQDGFAHKRFRFFDSVLLNVLDQNRRIGKTVFTELYQRNPAQRLFKFLDEQSSLGEELQVMLSTHLPTFTRAALNVMRR